MERLDQLEARIAALEAFATESLAALERAENHVWVLEQWATGLAQAARDLNDGLQRLFDLHALSYEAVKDEVYAYFLRTQRLIDYMEGVVRPVGIAVRWPTDPGPPTVVRYGRPVDYEGTVPQESDPFEWPKEE